MSHRPVRLGRKGRVQNARRVLVAQTHRDKTTEILQRPVRGAFWAPDRCPAYDWRLKEAPVGTVASRVPTLYHVWCSSLQPAKPFDPKDNKDILAAIERTSAAAGLHRIRCRALRQPRLRGRVNAKRNDRNLRAFGSQPRRTPSWLSRLKKKKRKNVIVCSSGGSNAVQALLSPPQQ
ncbi:hypothetical protein MRX96_050424 [Rhipicephalus microplus]